LKKGIGQESEHTSGTVEQIEPEVTQPGKATLEEPVAH
jgi:hypothetical protein